MKKVILSIAFMLTLLFCTATVTAQCNVEYIGQDTITGGDWDHPPVGSPVGVYGSYAHILPGVCETGLEIPLGPFEIPLGVYDPLDLLQPPFSWTNAQVAGLQTPCGGAATPPYNDEYESLDPPVLYYVRGTEVCGTGLEDPLDCIQYPAFTWGFQGWHATQTEHIEVYYRFLGGGDNWLMACWDDGGERCFPEYGYMDFELYFPEGMYLLSLYAYDYESYQYGSPSRTSQEYQIWDAAMTAQLLPSEQISGTEYDQGIYKIYRIEAGEGGCTIIVRVNNDAGHPPQVNILLSGIFVDKLNTAPGHTIGFWKNNVDKNLGHDNAKGKTKTGNAQLTKAEMEAILDGILLTEAEFCPAVVADFVGLTLDEASEIFNNHKKDDLPKAQAQILGLLCSVEYYTGMDADYLLSPIYLPDVGQTGGAYLGTLAGAVQLVLDEYCAGNYAVAHALATMLNEM